MTLRVTFASFVLAVACSEPPAADARTVKAARSGESTYVSISEPSNIPQNAACVRYCDRLTECWYAVSTGAPPLTRDEVQARCLSEQDDCRTKTTVSHCCGVLTDCMEFAECHAKSANEPADCTMQVKR